MPLVLPALLIAALAQGTASDPVRLVRDLQRTVDYNGGAAMERSWRASLRRRPRDPASLLAVATFARARYRYEESDSLLLHLAADPAPTWRAMAYLGMAAWRALGSDPLRADSLYERARALAREGGSRVVEGEATLGLAQLRQRSRGVAVGQALLSEWWQLLERPTAVDSAQRLCLTGAMDEQRGDTTGYRRIAAGARIAEARDEWRIAGTCQLAMAQTAERRGFVAGARGPARTALQHFARIRYELGTALASQWYGYVLVRAAQYAEARQLLERAILAARATRFASVEGWAHTGLAELHLELGDLARARAHAALASGSHAARGDRWGMAVSRGFEGQALEATGDLRAASMRFAESHEAFVTAGLPFNALPVLARRAYLQVRLGQLDSATATLALGDRLGRTAEGWGVEATVLRGIVAMREGRVATADSLLRSTRMAREWRAGRRSLFATSVAAREAQLALRTGRPAVADSALAAVLAALDDWRRRSANAEIGASLAQLRESWGGLRDVFADIVAQLVANGRVADAFLLVEQLRARAIAERTLRDAASLADSARESRFLVRQREATGGLAFSSAATLDDVRRALASDEAFVSYTLGLEDMPSTAIVVTRDTVATFTFGGRDGLVADIRRVVQLAASGADGAGAARRLGNALLTPITAIVPAGVTRFLLSPDGELTRVPYDLLRVGDGRLALDRATIAIAPSATVLLSLRRAPAASGRRVVAFGDPNYPKQGRQGASDAVLAPDDLRAGGSGAAPLPRLRASGAEARRVASYGLERDLRLSAAASEDAVARIDWRQVAVAHFATHALADPEGEAGTALVLSPGGGDDGYLTPADLGALRFQGALIVLSACRSSSGQVLWGEGLRGLTAPLLEAGARAVVATHWSIGDRRVVPFIDRFYAAMSRGLRVDDALRDAKLAAMRDGSSVADWGSFVVIGDGAFRVPLRSSPRSSSP